MLLLLACASHPVVDRDAGVREPVTRSCDAGDELRCHLPWPSSAHMVTDDQTATGVSAFVSEGEIGSQFVIVVTAKPGQDLAALEAVVDEELGRLLRDGPTANELERARTSLHK